MDDGSLSNPEGGNDHRWVTILTAGAVIAASLYLRINIQGRRLKVSDYFLCLAWCSAVATASFDIQFTVMGALHQNVKINLDGFNGSDDDTMLVMRLFWASSIPFFTTFYLCKGALLAVYVQIFPIFMHRRRMLLWAAIVYCGLAYLTSIILLFTICLPLSKHWSMTDSVVGTENVMCSASSPAIVFQVGWALHFFADILIFCLPWLIIPDLKIRRSLKIGVYCTFGLGIINMTFSLVRFITIQTAPVEALPFGLVEIIHMDAFDFKSNPEMVFIRYVRVEPDADGLLHLRDRWGPDMVNHYPALEALEILTHDLLIEWTWWIPEVYTTWSLRSFVWIINAETGEYLDAANSLPYDD
ncbi:hypothetical protein QIS74_13191 [Colletotrichum tabaci]|uniref:Rhodopsin domain-containing protein n=1 Tax=Colletotrichum tabaci TaxID=1209068 RepID=A0AAV9SUU3_9PEZI